jgi:uncharacterized phage protein (TIGR01671 family)
MSRVIKFRLWDGTEMKDVEMLSLTTFPRGELLQFTGLTDKNGKEIYEGDIIRIYIGGIAHLGQMKWNTRYAQFAVLANTSFDEPHYATQDKPEVIGNIYENPELLAV